MQENDEGLGIIFHSGSYDRISHGLNIDSVGATLKKEVKLFFTFWSLKYMKKEEIRQNTYDSEAELHKDIIKKNLKQGHMKSISTLIKRVKELGINIYVCSNSMGILNITRDELIDEVDRSMGLATFLTEIKDYQILFI
ncbi:MAG: DsrE/DsrF/DrsH-like family protein [Candidatus Thorarchaeota archaeon]